MLLLHIDAFTHKPFRGNPAAVCLLSTPVDDIWMQNVAAEMNLSETAFVLPNKEETFGLRWFTPITEVDLCGHATLAAAHALWETKTIDRNQPAIFQTRSGGLICRFHDGWIEMNFPADPTKEIIAPPGLLEAMKVMPLAIAKGKFDYLIEVASAQEVQIASPNFLNLKSIPARGIILTAAGQGEFDFVSRFFAPAVGIDEDPVTGSAHCCLAVYWANKLKKTSFQAQQVSHRTGIIRASLKEERVLISGQAVTIFETNLELGGGFKS